MFKRAERRQSKLRMALCGPSGSGKTYGALLIAAGIGGKIAVIDTECGSASLYADLLGFDVLELGAPYSPERYIEAIKTAENCGYDTLIIDSITHEWCGVGGILEAVDLAAKTKFSGNSYAAWSIGSSRHQKFIDALMQSKLHIICTIRSKTAYVENEKSGKKTMTKCGTQPQQRDGIEYEFTTVLDLTIDNVAVASKDRTGIFTSSPHTITTKTGEMLRDWLYSGSPVDDNDRITDDQKKMLICRLNSTHGGDVQAMLRELSDVCGREIICSNDLTKTEMDHYIDTVNGGAQC